MPAESAEPKKSIGKTASNIRNNDRRSMRTNIDMNNPRRSMSNTKATIMRGMSRVVRRIGPRGATSRARMLLDEQCVDELGPRVQEGQADR